MNNTKLWIRRAAAGAVLTAAPALIALGTAAASNAAPTGDSTSPSFSPTPTQSSQQVPWYQSTWHHQHQAAIQSYY